ncbi:MAG: response regulator [Proteobacteria bacterium]|nr:response regulator [Pseudomonadota bacterium]MBU4297645.1 response regulator [Pseudomonadota bacterium]MCG2749993.1 response regulator [Desulfobulbaceae bacterium]
MPRRSDDEKKWAMMREKIIGLGEKSIRKSYYPELRQKIIELEKANRELELEIIERQRGEEEIKRNYEIQTIINSLLKLSLQDISLDELFSITIDKILSLRLLSHQGKAFIFLVEDAPEVLVLKAGTGLPKQLPSHCATVPFGKCLCGLAALTREIQFADHDDERHTLRYENMQPHGHYAVPILLENRTIGLICIFLPDGHKRDAREEEFLASIAHTLAGIIQRKVMEKEKTRLEEELRQAAKMEAIGTLAGGIAHDFNNILTSIFGFSELARMDKDDPEKVVKNLDQIYKGALRAKDLVKQILTFSRRSEQQKRPFQLALLSRECLKLLRSTIPATIEIRQDIRSTGTALADPTQVHQIIMNLCTNAYHAMRQSGGILTLTLHDMEIHKDDGDFPGIAPGPYIRLEVTDTGSGMGKETLSKIFEPYFTTKEIGEGTGLGLAVVHGIVQGHGGHIAVASEPGKGTTFQVFLPRMDKDVADSPTFPADSPAQGGREHILIVDDEANIVKIAKEIFEDSGYQVTPHRTGTEALEDFQQQPEKYDLLITDMAMPGMTGVDLARQVLAIKPSMPVILCSGHSDMVNREQALAMGIRAYVAKPYFMSEMLRTIRKVLNRRNYE